MTERCEKYLVFSADDEMPVCVNCDNFGGNFECEKSCGAEHGWYGYRRTVDVQIPKERSEDK